MELATHPLTRPTDRGIKCQPLHRGVLSQMASGHHAVQQFEPESRSPTLVNVPPSPVLLRPCGNLRHPVLTCLALLSSLYCLLLVLSPLQDPRLAWAQPSNAVWTLTKSKAPPAGPSALCQLKLEDGTLNRRHHDAHRSHQDADAIPARLKGHPGRLPRLAPCSPAVNSVLPTMMIRCTPPIRGENDDF